MSTVMMTMFFFFSEFFEFIGVSPVPTDMELNSWLRRSVWNSLRKGYHTPSANNYSNYNDANHHNNNNYNNNKRYHRNSTVATDHNQHSGAKQNPQQLRRTQLRPAQQPHNYPTSNTDQISPATRGRAPSPSFSSSSSSSVPSSSPSKPPCKYFSLGGCKYGSSCRFAHILPLQRSND